MYTGIHQRQLWRVVMVLAREKVFSFQKLGIYTHMGLSSHACVREMLANFNGGAWRRREERRGDGRGEEGGHHMLSSRYWLAAAMIECVIYEVENSRHFGGKVAASAEIRFTREKRRTVFATILKTPRAVRTRGAANIYIYIYTAAYQVPRSKGSFAQHWRSITYYYYYYLI